MTSKAQTVNHVNSNQIENMSMKNKGVVIRFNKECIEQGRKESFDDLLSDKVINHSAPTGMPNGKESFLYFIKDVLRKAFSNIRVEILEQVAEGNLVTTRKRILGTHTGELFGITPTHMEVEIKVIDMIRLENGKYVEHWGQSNFDEVIKQLSSPVR